MKILQVAHSLPFLNQAGTEIYTYELSSELAKRHEVYVFTRVCDRKQKEYEVTGQNLNGLTIYMINNTFKYYDSFEMFYENEAIDRKFGELLDRIKPDIVHIQHLVFLSVGLIKKIKERGIPIVFTLHDYWLLCPRWHLLKQDSRPCERVFTANFDDECVSCVKEPLNIKKGAKGLYLLCRNLLPPFMLGWLKRIYFACASRLSNKDASVNRLRQRSSRIKTILNNVDFFLAPSQYLKNRFVDFGIPPEKINLSQAGLNGSLSMEIVKNKSDRIRFAFIGTILPAKGLHILIEAFNKIDRKNAELRIYGSLRSYDGFEYYLPYLKRIARNKNIRFMGEFSHADIASVFKEIDVLVVPSIWHENSPLVIKEAFLSKTPVIASRIGGIPELVNDGVNGLLFYHGESEDLQNKIEHLIKNPEIIDNLEKNISDVKSIAENAEEMEEIYKNLAGKSRLSVLLGEKR